MGRYTRPHSKGCRQDHVRHPRKRYFRNCDTKTRACGYCTTGEGGHLVRVTAPGSRSCRCQPRPASFGECGAGPGDLHGPAASCRSLVRFPHSGQTTGRAPRCWLGQQVPGDHHHFRGPDSSRQDSALMGGRRSAEACRGAGNRTPRREAPLPSLGGATEPGRGSPTPALPLDG